MLVWFENKELLKKGLYNIEIVCIGIEFWLFVVVFVKNGKFYLIELV